MPKVSVIIPCYNAERYLVQCIDSVLGQTLEDFELICVDDGSTDGTQQMLLAYQQRDPRVKVLTQSNQYAGVARNAGMEIATGQYLLFLDADDYFEPYMLQRLIERADATQADICMCGAFMDDVSTGELQLRFPRQDRALWALPTVFSLGQISDYAYFSVYPNPWNKLYRTAFIKEQGLQFQRTKRANDVFFVRASLFLAKRMTVISQPLVYYRVGLETSLTGRIGDRIVDSQVVFRALKQLLEAHGLWVVAQKRFHQSVVRSMMNCLTESRNDAEWLDTARFINAEMAPELGTKAQRSTLFEYPELRKVIMASPDGLSKLVPKSYKYASQMITAHHHDSVPEAQKSAVTVIVMMNQDNRHLDECVRSVLRQSKKCQRMVLADRFGTGDSQALVAGLANTGIETEIAQCSSIRDSITVAMDGSHSDYYLFLDGNDLLSNCAIEHAIQCVARGDLEALRLGGTVIVETPQDYRQYSTILAKYRLESGDARPISGIALMRRLTSKNGSFPAGHGWLLRDDVIREAMVVIGDNSEVNSIEIEIAALEAAKRVNECDDTLYIRRLLVAQAGDARTELQQAIDQYQVLHLLDSRIQTCHGHTKKFLDLLYFKFTGLFKESVEAAQRAADSSSERASESVLAEMASLACEVESLKSSNNKVGMALYKVGLANPEVGLRFRLRCSTLLLELANVTSLGRRAVSIAVVVRDFIRARVHASAVWTDSPR